MQTDENGAARGVSRRAFLRGVGVSGVAGGALAAMPGQTESAEASKLVGPGPVSITLNINGQDKTLSVEPRTTLLDAVRNHLDLTGSKKVCDRGTCGACTVIRDGRPIYSCTTLAIECEGSKITTIEGLGTPERMSPVQAAFVKNDAQQCGFCTPGFVVAVTALLKRIPNPTPEQIRAELGGNLCRCGTYAGIKQAVLDAAQAMKGAG